jgi:hypothetical protein
VCDATTAIIVTECWLPKPLFSISLYYFLIFLCNKNGMWKLWNRQSLTVVKVMAVAAQVDVTG